MFVLNTAEASGYFLCHLNTSGAVLGIEGEILLCLLSLPVSISSASPRRPLAVFTGLMTEV